ncbi:amino acid adenylation domain-containing protein [Aurantibacter sp.]|uniref:non-ribosomal peptide synthetase n=1 Tax=Aurantibacter sp. TaxID=2807103 RepID=UPI003263794E
MEEKKNSSLLSQWKLKQQEVPVQKIEKVVEGTPLVLSHGQQRLWLLQQLHPENPFYNYSEAYRFNGKLNLENLYNSLQKIYDAHDILRATYELVDGLPVAKVGAKEKLHLSEYDLSVEAESQNQIDKILLVDSARPFDLQNGPVIRFSLYKLTQEKYILLLNIHHIATDKWSMGIFRNLLANHYTALNAGIDVQVNSLGIQYHDYAFWQRNKVVDQKQMDYWLKKLEGEIPILELPKDYKRPIIASYKGAFKKQTFSSSLSKSVLDLSNKLETTPYVLLLSVYYVLLYRYTNQKDILIGTPISNRDHKSLEDLIGFFNDTVVLRAKFDENISFVDLVKIVRKTTLEAFANKDVAFEDLVKAIQPDRVANMNPLFNVMFLYHSVPKSPDFGSNLEFSQEVFDTQVAKFDLTLYIAEENNLLTSIFEYSSDLFNKVTIERLQAHFSLLLGAVVANPNEKIAAIPMLTSFEKEVFLQKESNLLSVEIPKKGIHDIITDIARANLNKKAVTFGSESITYQELIIQSNLVAKNILEITSGKNGIIGLCIQRSTDMIVGLLGILKAGCAYLPLDPTYPKERIDFMLSDANVLATVSNASTLAEMTEFDSKVLDISKLEANIEEFENDLPIVKSDDTAYVIYTSGSSGKPKGVPISHGNIINSTLGRKEFYDTNPDAFLLMSSISFDSSKAGIFWTLCTGGNLVISEKRLEQDVAKLTEVIKNNEVSHTLMLPSLYSMLLDHAVLNKLKGLKTVIVAGESCAANLCAKHFEKLPNANLYNEYGPTEATVWCIAYKIDKSNIPSVIPIGKPVANASIYILDESLGLLPYGATGEIFIGGPSLSGKYLNRPELSEGAYVDNPFDKEYETKLYKTGDLGRYKSDGNIEFLGRKDEQIKIRGFRVEIDEVQKAIMNHKTVNNAIVILKKEIPDTTSISAMDTNLLIEHIENRIGLDALNDILESIEHLSEEEQDYVNNRLE